MLPAPTGHRNTGRNARGNFGSSRAMRQTPSSPGPHSGRGNMMTAVPREGRVSAVTSTPSGPGVQQQGQAGPGLQPGWGVSPERQQAIAEVLGGLVPPAGRLAPAQLRAVTSGLAARRGLWADLVVRDPDVRWYLPLHRSNSCDVWLLAWERGQDTDWHDHGGASGSFAVAEGRPAEPYPAPGGRRSARRRLLASEAGGVLAPPLPHLPPGA